MELITVWHRQLSSQRFSFLQVVCAGGFVWPSIACEHRGQKRMHPDKCLQKVTVRHGFLNWLTLAAERGKKAHGGTHCWQPLRGVSMKQPRTHTNNKTDSHHPLACAALMMRGRHRSMGGPIRVRGRREKGDDSLVQSDDFLPLFFLFMPITCKHLSVLHASFYKFLCPSNLF